MKDILRCINTKIWTDPWYQKLDIHGGNLFLYLLTNQYINMIGIYEISIETMLNESKVREKETIEQCLQRFSKDKKIYYENNYIVIENYRRHQSNEGEKTQKGILNNFNRLPEKVVKGMISNGWASYLIALVSEYADRYSYPLSVKVTMEPKQKEEPEIEPDKIKQTLEDILAHWNSKPNLTTHRKLDNDMIANGKKLLKLFSPEQIKKGIDDYYIIVTGPEYWFNYKYNLDRFLDPKKFKPFANPDCLTNFKDVKYKAVYKKEDVDYGY